MNSYETLDVFAKVFTLGANVVVAGICWTAFQKLRVRALMLLAISASIAVFASFADIFLLRRVQDDSTYALLWAGITILWVIDIGLYATGVAKLVAWITPQKPVTQAGADQPAKPADKPPVIDQPSPP